MIFSPDNVNEIPLTEPGCVLWMDAADTSKITTSSNAVSLWKDKSSSQNNASQGVAANQPLSGTRTHNGLNVIDFDGVNDFLQFSRNTALSAPFTVFVFGQYDTSTIINAIFGRQTAAINGQFVIRKETSAVFNSFLFGSGGGSSINFPGNLSPNIHCVYFQNGGAINYSINNGAFLAGATTTGYDNAVATPLVVGAANNSGSDPFDGFVGEIIVYNRVLVSSEIIKINRYLANKWGAAIS